MSQASCNCSECGYVFSEINDTSNCPKCGSSKKNKNIVLVETVSISDHLAITKEGKRTLKNYYALTLAIVISVSAIYTFSIQSSFLVNAIITVLFGFLDSIAFYFAITKYHFKETHS